MRLSMHGRQHPWHVWERLPRELTGSCQRLHTSHADPGASLWGTSKHSVFCCCCRDSVLICRCLISWRASAAFSTYHAGRTSTRSSIIIRKPCVWESSCYECSNIWLSSNPSCSRISMRYSKQYRIEHTFARASDTSRQRSRAQDVF